MKRLPRASYTVEYKVAAVQQVLAGKTAAEVSRELGVVEQTLHNWMKAYRGGKLGEGGGKAVTPEQMEISRSRVEQALFTRGSVFDENYPAKWLSFR